MANTLRERNPPMKVLLFFFSPTKKTNGWENISNPLTKLVKFCDMVVWLFGCFVLFFFSYLFKFLLNLLFWSSYSCWREVNQTNINLFEIEKAKRNSPVLEFIFSSFFYFLGIVHLKKEKPFGLTQLDMKKHMLNCYDSLLRFYNKILMKKIKD